MRPHLPEELREVFFTDGDRALSFIEGTKGEQTQRVKGAIRSLLGLEVVENAIKHISQVSRNLNNRVTQDTNSAEEIQQITTLISGLETTIPSLKEEIEKQKNERERLDELEKGADKQLSDALVKGNKEELEKDRKEARRFRESAEIDSKNAATAHASLFKSMKIGQHLLAKQFSDAKKILDELHNKGKIPNQTIPVLEDRLQQPTCICGESLNPNEAGGAKRRAAIEELIEASMNSDAIQKQLTDLYYSSQDLLTPFKGRPWAHDYERIFTQRQKASERKKHYGEREREIENRIAKLPDIDIKQLRGTRDHYREQSKKAYHAEIRASSQISAAKDKLDRAIKKRESMLKKDDRGLQINAEFEVANDAKTALERALETMKTEELQKVSDKMNDLFLDMIGADSSQRSIIQKAAITPAFRIVVFGRHEQTLDPSQDLNGASRRALTVSFILALTLISGVEAPNVIDTPLGMMSGYVKRSVLRLASEHSSQLVLFLTPAEIAGCEDILDKKAGKVYTVTNPAHYPKILVNDPGVSEAGVLMCECNHREDCSLCKRRQDAIVEQEISREEVV